MVKGFTLALNPEAIWTRNLGYLAFDLRQIPIVLN